MYASWVTFKQLQFFCNGMSTVAANVFILKLNLLKQQKYRVKINISWSKLSTGLLALEDLSDDRIVYLFIHLY